MSGLGSALFLGSRLMEPELNWLRLREQTTGSAKRREKRSTHDLQANVLCMLEPRMIQCIS